jgi:hypothetical protein
MCAEAAATLDISPASQPTPQTEEIYQWLIKKENIGKRGAVRTFQRSFGDCVML